MTKDLPSPELLRKLLRYEPETGKLFWRERTPDMFENGKQSSAHNCVAWNNRSAGKEAFFSQHKHGYRYGRVSGRAYLAHRVIWAMHTNAWPVEHIDHIDGKKDNNVIENLREATRSENMWNQKAPTNNTSGYKGVYWQKTTQKWCARIKKNTKNHYLGLFDCPKEAHQAYCKAAKELHGKYANTGV